MTEHRLFDFQAVDSSFLATAQQALLASDMGLGKTASTIHAMRALHEAGKRPFPALVICPNSVKPTWQREAEAWWPGLKVVIVRGSAAQRRALLEESAHIYIINWESIRLHSRLAPYGSISLKRCKECGGEDERVTPARCEVHLRELNHLKFQTVIGDECFTAGTPVSTPSGLRSIEELEVGDVVYGYDHVRNCVVESRVTDLFARQSTEVVAGWNATPNHPVYVKGEGYRAIGDLTGDETLLQADVLPLRGPCRQISARAIEVLLGRMSSSKSEADVRVDTSTPSRAREFYVQELQRDNGTHAIRGSQGRNVQHDVSNRTTSQAEHRHVDVRTVHSGLPKPTRLSTVLLEEVLEHIQGEHARGASSSVRCCVSRDARSDVKAQSSGAEAGIVTGKSVQQHEHAASGTQRARQEVVAQGGIHDEYQPPKNITRGQALVVAASSARAGVSRVVRRLGFATDVCISGHSIPRSEASRGSRRWSAPPAGEESCRCDPNGAPHDPGTVGHPLLELRSSERYSEVCRESALKPDEPVTVFSLTTETGNYFAHNVLVRNCHRAKSPSAKQTRALWSIGDAAEYRFALTGTPIANAPDDLWSIMRFLSPAEFPSRVRYIQRWCAQVFNVFGQPTVVGLKPETRDEFYRIVNSRMRRMPKDLVLDFLPPIVTEVRDVPMLPVQEKAYASMRDNMIAQLESGEVLATTSPLTRLTRLVQFASAFAELTPPNDDGKQRAILSEPSNKLDAFMDDYESGDFGEDSIIVFAQSRQLIDLLSARLTKKGIAHGLITGAIAEDDRQKYIDEFQAGKFRLILITIQAGGVGLTLTKARVRVFLQRSWSLVDQKQAEGRNHRIGSEVHDSILHVDYVSPGTVEEKQLTALDGKGERLEEILRDRDLIGRMLKDEQRAAEALKPKRRGRATAGTWDGSAAGMTTLNAAIAAAKESVA